MRRQIKPFKIRKRMRPIDQQVGVGLRIAGQRGGCRMCKKCGCGLRLAGQKGGCMNCKQCGRGLSIAGQHGGRFGKFNLRRFVNRDIVKPVKRWFSRHDDDIVDGLQQTSKIAAQVAPFMAFV